MKNVTINTHASLLRAQSLSRSVSASPIAEIYFAQLFESVYSVVKFRSTYCDSNFESTPNEYYAITSYVVVVSRLCYKLTISDFECCTH